VNIYECDELIRSIEAIAEQNDGEVPDEKLGVLVAAQTKSIESLTKMGNYIAFLNSNDAECKKEIARIKGLMSANKKRIESIKKWLLPYFVTLGKPVTAGTHKFSTRKSKGVVLADGFDVEEYMVEIPATSRPDKKKITEDIKNGIEVKGAVLEERINLSFK
jgi:hypothetical protein